MGEVYLVQHPRLRRREALKVLPAALTGDREFRRRFEREADIAASLWRPHIVGIHDRGEFDGQLWISMDYVDGIDAARRVRKYPQGLSPVEVREIVSAVAEALDYAHQRRLLHRDVKPANVLLTDPEAGEQRILLADFGIARRIEDAGYLTATNTTMGTVAYGAPEQLTGSSIDGHADQYALAASAFHLLTGIPPFHPSNPAIAISQHLSGLPPKLATYSPELGYLDPIMSRALARRPGSRFERCVDFAGAFGRQIDASAARSGAVQPQATRKSALSTAAKFSTINPAALLIAAVTMVAQLFAREQTPFVTVSPPSSAASSPAPKPAPPASPPKAVVGAKCAKLGTTGLTNDGATAYCSRLQYTDRHLWSLHPGDIPNPVLSARPATPPPADDQAPVRIRMQQTDRSWNVCANDIHHADTTPP
jgi:serine/threonine-protein kinase